MSRQFEIALMVFLGGLLIILFRWSITDRYVFYTLPGAAGGYLVEERSGNIRFVVKAEGRMVMLK